MRVEGVEIAEETIQKALNAQRDRKAPFTFYALTAALWEAGVPKHPAYRCADRVLQRERKAGRMRFVRIGRDTFWSFVEPEEKGNG